MPLRKILICLPFILLFNSVVVSQIAPEWLRIYNGQSNEDDGFIDCIVGNSGDLYCGGYTHNSLNKYKQLLIKYNAGGTELWRAVYNEFSNSDDYTSTMALDSAGNVYLCGAKNDSLVLLVKYNNFGNVVWGYDFNTKSTNLNVSKIGINIYGDVYITGYGTYAGTRENVITMKVDSTGKLVWVDTFNSRYNKWDCSFGLALCPNGIIVTGYSEISILYDALTFKYSPDGELLWMKRFGNPGTGESGYVVKTDNEGNIFVAGEKGDGSVNRDILTIKYDSSGNFVWSASYGTYSFDCATDLVCDNVGNVYVTGMSVQQGTAYTTIKYNSIGLQQWIAIYTGPDGASAANSIALDSYGNIFVTGGSNSQNNGSDIATIKYNNNGVQQWVHRFNGTGNSEDEGWAIRADINNNIFVVGRTANISHSDAIIIKYSHLIHAGSENYIIPQSFRVHQNYPNPFNPVTKIKFELPETGLLSLNIFDVNGKKVISKLFDVDAPGEYEYDLDLTNFSSGVYFYKISINDFSEIKKMILLK